MKRKWEIEKLKNSKQFKKTANIILKNRIESLLSFVEKYFRNLTVENLHDIRIALRRVRYSMELFIICYDNKVFVKFYNKIQLLQNLSGAVRDIDVLLENIELIKNDKLIKVNPEMIINAKEKKGILEEKFKLELMKFTLSKILKDFLKQIS